MQPLSNFVGNLGYVSVCLLGGFLAGGNTITIGDIQAFIQYVRQFNQPIAQLAQTMNMLQSTAAAAERVFELKKMKLKNYMVQLLSIKLILVIFQKKQLFMISICMFMLDKQSLLLVQQEQEKQRLLNC